MSGQHQVSRPHSAFEDEFLDYLRQGELRYARLKRSGEVLEYTARPCLDFDGTVEWLQASGRATLYSYAIYHQRFAGDMQLPYNVAQVELVEGPMLVARVVLDSPAGLRVGMSLQARFDAGLLVFVPLPPGARGGKS